jgi:hypothetical protein
MATVTLAVLDVYLRAKAASGQKSVLGKATELGGFAANLRGMAYGAELCAESGPYGAAACGIIGGIGGEKSVHAIADTADAAAPYIGEAVDYVFGAHWLDWIDDI